MKEKDDLTLNDLDKASGGSDHGGPGKASQCWCGGKHPSSMHTQVTNSNNHS